MKRQLFIYYRIPKADIALGMQCANIMATRLKQQGLGQSQLFQREETDKPYFTLMEVIHPAPEYSSCSAAFIKTLEQIATATFSALPTLPSRHVELFDEITDEPGGELIAKPIGKVSR
jgi:hypothetical protein